MARIALIVLGGAILVGGLLPRIHQAAATSHPTFDSSPPWDQYWTAEFVNGPLQLSSASGGTGTLVYTLTQSDGSDLPAGFVFDATALTLSSTVEVAAGNHSLHYKVTNGEGYHIHSFGVEVAPPLSVADPNSQIWSVGELNTPVELPAATGGRAPLTYSLRVDNNTDNGAPLPAGFVFDESTRMLSSTRIQVDNDLTFRLRYRVTDANGATDSQTFDVQLNTRGQTFDASQTDLAWTADHVNTTVTLPSASGGPASLTYALGLSDGSPLGTALPAGFVFDDTTRTLSSTTALAPGSHTLRYTVNAYIFISIYQDFSVTVAAAPSVSAADLEFTAGFANSVVLDEASGGSGTLVYSVRVDDGTATGGDLPAALVFDASSRTLSSTASPASYSLFYKVTDANQASDSADFTVTVNAAVSVPAVADVEFTAGFVNSVVLDEASGGSGTLVYSVRVDDGTATGGDLPFWALSFDASSRTLLFTADLAALPAYSLFYKVTDANGASDTAAFTVTVNAAVSVSAVGDVEFTAGVANSVVLDEASGGTGTLGYELKKSDGSALPAVFSFDDTTRTLSSAVGLTTSPSSYSLTYTATDANGASASADFTVTVNDAVSVSASGLGFTAGFANSEVLAAGSGGTAPLTYSVVVDDGTAGGAVLPSVLLFDDTTRTLSSAVGLTTSPSSYSLTYTATDANGASASADFTVTVNDAVSVPVPADVVWTAGFVNSEVLAAGSGGTGTLVYTLTKSDGSTLPTGFEFDDTTRTLSSTAGLDDVDTHTLTYTATDANGASASAGFTITVNDAVSVSASGLGFTAGFANSEVLAAGSGGTGTLAYTVTRSGGAVLPSVLLFDDTTRTLSSTAGLDTSQASYSLTYEVEDANGASASADFTVTVNDAVSVPVPADVVWTAGFVNSEVALAAGSGGTGTLVYTLTKSDGSTLPTGFEFDDTTRTLSSTAGLDDVDTHTLRYTATDANGASASASFTITVNAAPSVSADDLAWTAGVENSKTLAQASGGTAPFTYSVATLPSGFSFTESSRELKSPGTLAASPASYSLTYTATDANGASASASFTITVNAAPSVSAADLAWTAGHANSATLDPASGGTAPFTYSVATLPSGFSFTESSRELKSPGTLAASPASYSLTYTATDANGASASASFTITVNAAPSVSAADLAWTAGVENSKTLAQASGGTAPFTYSVATLPSGFSFTESSRELKSPGTLAASPASYSLTYTATDANGASASASFTITVNAAPSVSAADLAWTAGHANSATLDPASGGTAPFTYSVATLPSGFSFTESSRELKSPGTLAASPASYSLTYTATDANGASASASFTITVNAAPSVSAADLAWTAGHANSATLDPASGGTAPFTYSVATLPSGFSFTESSRELKSPGTLAASPASYSLTYTATDANGASASASFTITVNAAPSVSAADLAWTAGVENSKTLAQASGGTAPFTYSVATLPSGFSFTESSRELKSPGTLAASPASYSLTYTATDANGASASASFTITVNAAPSVSAADLAWTAGVENSKTLAQASGGTAPFTYSVATLPSGFSFTESSRELKSPGTLAASPASYSLTYTATDANGASASASFTITVNAAPSVSAADLAWTAGVENSKTLAQASGGTAPFTYSVATLPSGFSFTESSRELKSPGTLAASPASYSLTYTATDANGASASASFTITVNAAPSVSAADLAWTAGVENSKTLAQASGGTAPFTYSVATLPSGFSFTESSRELKSPGTLAASPASYSLTYTATDANGASASASFTITVNAAPSVSAADLAWTAGVENSKTLAQASGGTAPFTYSVATRPSGFSFTESSRELKSPGTLAASPASYSLTYTATDANGASASASFTITVNAAPSVSAADLAWTAGHANSATLDPASGGTAPFTYSVATLPSGFSFTESSRELKSPGTLAASPASYSLTYTATDANGASASASFTITVNAAPSVSAADLAWTAGHANSATLDPASGGTAPFTYSVATLPSGFSFTESSRELKSPGTLAASPASYSLTYTATDANGASASASFTITVNAAPSVSAADLAWTAGVENSKTLAQASGGTAPFTYSVATLPSGFSFTESSRELKSPGTLAASPASYSLTYTATDANGASASASFTITVNAAPSVSAADLAWTAGVENSKTLAQASGGTAPFTYSVATLPSGFSFTESSRELKSPGTLAASPASYSLTYTATDANGASASASFTITVNAAPSVSADDLAWTAGVENSKTLAQASGGTAPFTYSVMQSDGTDWPTVLAFDDTTRTLSSTADLTTSPPSYTLTYTATDQNGVSASVTFRVRLAAELSGGASVPPVPPVPPVRIPDPDDLLWTAYDVGSALASSDAVASEADASTTVTVDAITKSVVLPSGVGMRPLSHALRLSDGSPLPAWFEFDASTRMLTISAQVFSTMSAVEASSYTLRYTVTDGRRKSASSEFVVTLVSKIPDVGVDAPYRQAVVWMVANGITTGCAQDRFCPDSQLKRSHIVTFLWRAVGRPTPSRAGSEIFSDVEEGSYPDLAIGWAQATGLTLGCTSGQPGDPRWRFCPADTLTRAQAAAFLYRLLQVDPPRPPRLAFEDVDPGSYYANAAAWLRANHIVAPCEPGRFCPHETPSRADFADFMYRIAATPSSWATDRAPLPQLAVVKPS